MLLNKKRKIKEKRELIEKLNNKFRTILSYGTNNLIPVGVFIIKDLIKDKVVLSKVDDDKVRIELPLKYLLEEHGFFDKAEKNADKLGLSTNLDGTVQGIVEESIRRIIDDEKLEDLVNVETIELDKCEAIVSKNGELQDINSCYSLCPIDLGRYKIRVRQQFIRLKNYYCER